MVFSYHLVSDRDLNFKLSRINWLDQEITRYRDYEWKATSIHTAIFVAILYFLIDPNRKLDPTNIIVSKLYVGVIIFAYLIVAIYQLFEIHVKLNKSRNERDEYLIQIGEEPKHKPITTFFGFYEGIGAITIILFIFWLIVLFYLDIYLLCKKPDGVVMATIICLKL